MAADSLDIVVVYPELLGLYGDRGNGLALVHRSRARGIRTRVVDVHPGDVVPETGDLYLLGGGEDAPMMLAWELLVDQPGLARALDRGAPCLAVCAGFQLLSEEFAGPDGKSRPGLGVLDVRCSRLTGARAVGEVVTEPVGLPVGPVTGYENHQGDAVLGAEAKPLGRVRTGIGNGVAGDEGAVQGGVVATYLHGPVLARNPAIADHLLAAALGGPLEPWVDTAVERLRRERLDTADRDRRGRLSRWRVRSAP
ncbi:MAG: glutamine amidotransferase [Actinomycetota bacterium]|nr:glutamine amidotransferase [Actinomycetota bacterium]